jgi:hypothetical protein
MKAGGAAAGAKNSLGCGSNVITADGSDKSSAASTTRHRLMTAMNAVEITDCQAIDASAEDGKPRKPAQSVSN